MESNASGPGSRQLDLKKMFNFSLRGLLTSCSGEEFGKAFPSFTASEQERLHQLFVQVIPSLHQVMEEEFESVLLETQAGQVLDTVDELVEEQTLDPLHSEKSNVGETAQKLSEAKKNEVYHLMSLLQKAEEQKHKIEARVEQLKKQKQEFSGPENVLNELRLRNKMFGL